MGLTKAQRVNLRKRILDLLAKEPWLTNYTIGQRFNCGVDYVSDVRRSLGLYSPRTEELTDNDFENSLVPKLIPKQRKKPHYINFREKK